MSGIDFGPLGRAVQEMMDSIDDDFSAGAELGVVVVLAEVKAPGRIEYRVRVGQGDTAAPASGEDVVRALAVALHTVVTGGNE